MTAVAISPHAIHVTDRVGTGATPARLAASPAPLSAADLAARFTGKGPWKKRLPQIIDTLEALGRVQRQGDVVSAIG